MARTQTKRTRVRGTMESELSGMRAMTGSKVVQTGAPVIAASSGWDQIARALEQVNPKITDFFQEAQDVRNERDYQLGLLKSQERPDFALQIQDPELLNESGWFHKGMDTGRGMIEGRAAGRALKEVLADWNPEAFDSEADSALAFNTAMEQWREGVQGSIENQTPEYLKAIQPILMEQEIAAMAHFQDRNMEKLDADRRNNARALARETIQAYAGALSTGDRSGLDAWRESASLLFNIPKKELAAMWIEEATEISVATANPGLLSHFDTKDASGISLGTSAVSQAALNAQIKARAAYRGKIMSDRAEADAAMLAAEEEAETGIAVRLTEIALLPVVQQNAEVVKLLAGIRDNMGQFTPAGRTRILNKIASIHTAQVEATGDGSSTSAVAARSAALAEIRAMVFGGSIPTHAELAVAVRGQGFSSSEVTSLQIAVEKGVDTTVAQARQFLRTQTGGLVAKALDLTLLHLGNATRLFDSSIVKLTQDIDPDTGTFYEPGSASWAKRVYAIADDALVSTKSTAGVTGDQLINKESQWKTAEQMTSAANSGSTTLSQLQAHKDYLVENHKSTAAVDIHIKRYRK